jgi:hypothetical protein
MPVNIRILGIVGALVFPAVAGWYGYGMSAHWVNVNGSDCEVWNEDGDPGMAAWNGDCVDGRGEGPGTLTLTSENGFVIRYQGVMSAGKFQGDGEWSSSDGARIQGPFRDSAFTGRVIATWSGNRYEGMFDNDVPTGTGRCQDATGNSGACQLSQSWDIIWVN